MARESADALISVALWGAGLTLVLLATLEVFLRLARFRRRFPTLREWEGPQPASWPRLSVIVPSRNEAGEVEKATRSLLAQDYPNLEIVAIDDRSEDATGAILDGLAAEDPRLTVVHVRDLPEGWLGKNHAVKKGAAVARGEWLLFTDGDVVFDPGALRKSVAFAQAHGLGHFVALPHFVAEGFLERSFVATFVLHFATAVDVSRLHVARSFAFIGVGAFGLVRRSAYDAIHGHDRLAFEVADDVKLGLLLRRAGVAQGCLDSDGLVRVRWQQGFLATLRGLEKNAFSAFEWNVPLGLAVLPLFFAQNLLPWAPFILESPPGLKVLGGLTLALRAVMVGAAARRTAGGSGLEALAMPLTTFLFPCVIAWSVFLTIVQGGIRWRGTFYPLRELRQRCVRVLSFRVKHGIGWAPPARPRR